MLVDFGRSVDLETAKREGSSAVETKLVGEATTKDMMCVAMRRNLPFSYDVDTFGVCAAAHVLLFGKHIEIEQSSHRWMPKQQLKPYMHKEIWNDLFGSFLNLDELSMAAMGSHPNSVRQIRSRIESHLRANADVLTAALRAQAKVLPRQRAEL